MSIISLKLFHLKYIWRVAMFSENYIHVFYKMKGE